MFFLFLALVRDKNGTAGPKTTPEWQIAQHLSERGFAVLRYDKRGVGPSSYHFSNSNVWGNATANDFLHDAEKALNVLIQQPEVDPKRINLIGHSEGTIYAPRIAIDNPTKVKNIILMGTVAQNLARLGFYQHSTNVPVKIILYFLFQMFGYYIE